MATQAQIDANRKNAQKSTGPTTAEGKAKSCLNHLSHGLTSAGFNRSMVFLSFENPEEFKGLLLGLITEYQPSTTHQQILVEKMALNQFLSLRATCLQGMALNGSVPHSSSSKDLGVLIRYQTTADWAYHKAHEELVKAQKESANSEIGFDSREAFKAALTASRAARKAENPPAEQQRPAPPTPVTPTSGPTHEEMDQVLKDCIAQRNRAA